MIRISRERWNDGVGSGGDRGDDIGGGIKDVEDEG